MAGILVIKRVSYGKSDTPPDLREYRAKISGVRSPVGTISEWKDFAKKNSFDLILIVDKDNVKYCIPYKD